MVSGRRKARLQGVTDRQPRQPRASAASPSPSPAAAAGAGSASSAASRGPPAQHCGEGSRPDDNRSERFGSDGEPPVARLQEEVGSEVLIQGRLVEVLESALVAQGADGGDADEGLLQ